MELPLDSIEDLSRPHHPLIYGQVCHLPPVETHIIAQITSYAETHHKECLLRAKYWLHRLRRMAYPDGDSYAHVVASPTPGLSADELAGSPQEYCRKNGIDDDDLYCVILSVTMHQVEGVVGSALLEQAQEAVERLLRAHGHETEELVEEGY